MEDQEECNLPCAREGSQTLVSSGRYCEDTWLCTMAQQLGDAVNDMSLGKAKGWTPGDAGAPLNRFWLTSLGAWLLLLLLSLTQVNICT